jgi:hypothetical protein
VVDNGDNLVPFFVHSLAFQLENAERQKGSPLTYDEVIRIRDNAICVMVSEESLRAMEESRGYRDIDPENCWNEWQALRQRPPAENGQ